MILGPWGFRARLAHPNPPTNHLFSSSPAICGHHVSHPGTHLAICFIIIGHVWPSCVTVWPNYFNTHQIFQTAAQSWLHPPWAAWAFLPHSSGFSHRPLLMEHLRKIPCQLRCALIRWLEAPGTSFAAPWVYRVTTSGPTDLEARSVHLNLVPE